MGTRSSQGLLKDHGPWVAGVTQSLQQEFPAGCGSPADVQVGALAGLESAGFEQALYKNHTLS